jgi:hypothetical protein
MKQVVNRTVINVTVSTAKSGSMCQLGNKMAQNEQNRTGTGKQQPVQDRRNRNRTGNVGTAAM